MISSVSFSQVSSMTTFTVEYKTAAGNDTISEYSTLNKNSFRFIGGKGEVYNSQTGQTQMEENSDLYIWIENVGTYNATIKASFGENLLRNISFSDFGYCISKKPHPEVSDNVIKRGTIGSFSEYCNWFWFYGENISLGELEENTDYTISGKYPNSEGILTYPELQNLEYITTYYVRPYVEIGYNKVIMYGGEKSFTTQKTIEGVLQNEKGIAGWHYYDAKTGVTLDKDALLALSGYSEEPEENVMVGIIQDLSAFFANDTIAFPAYPTMPSKPQEPQKPQEPAILEDPGELLEYEAWCEMEGRNPNLTTSNTYYRRYVMMYENEKAAYDEWLSTYPDDYAAYQKDSTEYADIAYPAYLQELAKHEAECARLVAEYEETCKSIAATNQDNYNKGISILGRLRALSYRSIECTDGTLYVVKEIPSDIVEAFQEYFYGGISFSPWGNVNTDDDSRYTTQVRDINNVPCDESWGVPNNEYIDFIPNGNNSPSIAINIPKYLHPATYAVSVTVVHPSPEEDMRGYHFMTYIYEKKPESGRYTSPVMMIPPEDAESDGNYYVTDGTKRVETISLGEYTFNGMPNSMIQFYNYVRNSEVTKYNRNIKISQISLTPVKE